MNINKVIISTALSAIILSSCTKNDGLNNTDKMPVNYDALYVLNSAGNSLSVINRATEKVEKTISLGTMNQMMGSGMMNGGSNGYNLWPYHFSLSPDKSKLAITEPGMDFNGGYEMMQSVTSSGGMGNNHYQHHNGNSSTVTADVMQMHGKILILDAITGDLLKEIGVEGMPYDAIFSHDGKELWTALMMPAGKVMVFDADSYLLLNTISVGNMPAGVAFSDDGNKVYIANGMSGSITVIDAETKMVIDSIMTGQGTVGAFPGMDGMMYADNEKDMTISIINTMNDMVTDSLHLGFTPGMISRNSMMNQLWVSDPAEAKIHLWTQTGSNYMPGGYISVGSGAGAMIFSPTGETCYVSNQNDNSVSVADVEGFKEIKRIPVGEKPNSLIIRYK
jgi:YVTN family beta-propeller protein